MPKPKIDWVKLDKSADPKVCRTFCERCGRHNDIPLPIGMMELPKAISRIQRDHALCKPK